MDENLVQEILDALFSSLEELETQTVAILQFLKDKGLASEEELAPHLEQAANASNVRWRAARVRINHLVSSATKTPETVVKKESARAAAEKKSPDPALDTATETDSRKVDTQAHDAQKPNDSPKSEEDAAAGAESSEKKQKEKNGPLEENPSNTATEKIF
jgi:hypothetical protein